jgi:glycosyltransferase involved in cell wall biosynthesis
MRIGFFGNLANNFYQVAKALRKLSNYDAQLYLDAREYAINMPESDDPALKDNYPDWIHKKAYLTPSTIVAPWRSELVEELSTCDVVVVSGFGPVFSQWVRKPSCFFVTGGDLACAPFPWTFRFQHRGVKAKLVTGALGAWQRRGILAMSEIWTQPYSPYVNALRRLTVEPRRVSSTYFPVVIDTQKFRFDHTAADSPEPTIRRLVADYDFILFHPSRLMINPHPDLRATGQWKQNDLLFRGFAEFLRRTSARRAVLVMPDRALSPDIDLARDEVRRLGIENHVLWIKAPEAHGFTRDELVRLYCVSHVVADDFGIGWFGGVALEALSVGRPLLTYVDEQVMSKLYPWHPMLSANSADAIADWLTKLYHEPDWRQAIGLKGRQWIELFHSADAAGHTYVKRIEELALRVRATS